MKKTTVAGLAITAALLGGSAQADELYVHNRPFTEATFRGRNAYVPVSSFLKSLGMGYQRSGNRIVVKKGASAPALEDGQVTVSYMGKEQTFNGSVAGGKVYVDLKPLAELLGYKVNHNYASGIVDVVEGRLKSEADEKAAEELASAKEADRTAKKEAWDKVVAAHREKVEARKAKEAEKAEAKEEGGEKAEGTEEAKTEKTEKSEKVEKEMAKEPAEVEKVEPAKEETKPAASEKENEPPPKAELVTLSEVANPNLYTGEVEFKVVVENQGYASAENVTARLKVIGPDNRTWVDKTVYGRNLRPDQRWEVTETYKHRDGAAMPRGNFTIQFTPNYKSGAAVKK